jgi:hypothetical protein
MDSLIGDIKLFSKITRTKNELLLMNLVVQDFLKTIEVPDNEY